MKPQQYHYRVVISYKGTHFFGWQDLGDNGKKPTVQFLITQVLRKICKLAACTVSAASRTDAGVHAAGQVAKLSIVKDISAEKLQLGMNSLLPADIRIMACTHCPTEFNANRGSVSKIYRYYFSLDEVSTPLLNDIVAHVDLCTDPLRDKKQVLETMGQGCEHFVGEYDFYSFSVNNKQVKSTLRRILRLELRQAHFSNITNNSYYFEIEGSGFLRQMIRYIVGALFELARGNIEIAEIDAALRRRNEHKLSTKAKARGLHLMQVNY
ncbi:MAG: tRNA pseudouridine(38-40) synthase TruA [Pseudomonadales bacterium]|nr:tRNA pseudouridine(38-40) synthase TruA [Pseudomonadales bacterium]